MAARSLITIVGVTASGKSALALDIARKHNGEIVCADSRTIYKGMDIGTAKPTKAEQAEIPHHLLDVITPDQQFSAADFQKQALAAIADIHGRGRVPIMVGGTGLYVDAVLYDFTFRAPANLTLRAQYEKLPLFELQQALAEKGIPLPTNAKNPRHLIRALETDGEVSKRGNIRGNTLVLGLSVERKQLDERIKKRIDVMITTGLLTEIENLAKQYSWEAPGLQAPGYRAFRPFFEGKISLEEAKEQFVRNDLQLAKRQRTWFKRSKDIQWASSAEQAQEAAKTFLDNLR